jgi:outer membrane protein TolC
MKIREAEVGVATRQVDAARQELRSSYSVGGGLFWEGGTDRLVVFTFGVELPFWKVRKQRPRLVAAERELEAARFEAASTASEVRAEAASLVIAWRQADEQVERYRTAILPQTSAVLDATRSSYLGGRGDFTAVAEEFRRWIEVRVELARREAASFTARARLDVLVAPPEHGDWMKQGEVAAAAIGKEGQR